MIQAIDNFLGELLKRWPGNKTTESDREKLRAALSLAARVHGERTRPTGESYLDHARAVAAGLNEMGVDDTDTIVAALLHDALLPHTGLSEALLAAEFGPAVANVIRSGKSLDDYARRASHNKAAADLGLEAQQDRRTLEALRRALLSIIEGDIRIILIRMVDCLQDLRRADRLDRDAQRRLAWEALHIYAPIANRLGIWHLKWQLEDSAFRYLEPEGYREIALRLNEGRERRALKVKKAASRLRRRLSNLGLKADVTGRPKHMYSIYRKMARKELNFDQIYDIQALRVILEPPDKATYRTLSSKAKDDVDRDLCYQVLGAVHSLWQPIRGEFDDYIGSPKPNGYMSLHTAVIDETGQKLEVQIRTQRMHEEAEHGVAAHWAYKEQDAKVTNSSQKRIQNLRELLATLQEAEEDLDGAPPLDLARLDERIHVFTPTDDVMDLPVGATPIDFAYQIHTELGHRCRGASVNGKMVTLDYKLKSGDKVKIIDTRRGGPNRDWMNPSLGYTGSARTRGKIRHWFRQQDRAQNILQGREVVEREIRRLNLAEPCTVEQVAEAMKFDNLDDFLSLVGFGDITPTQLAGAIATRGGQTKRTGLLDLQPLLNPPGGQKGLTVRGVGGVHTRLAQCCTPVAPEPIIGYITRNQGITIHTQNCPQVAGITERERLIDVEWGTEEKRAHPVPVVITAEPRDGLIEDLVNVLRGQQIAVPKTKLTNDDEMMRVYLLAEVTDLTQLNYLMTKLSNLPGVRDVRRQNWR